MAVLVIGASSQIGYFLLQRLTVAGESVLALSREARASKTQQVRWLQASVPDQMPVESSFDAIVSFGPLVGLAEWLSHLTRAPAPRLVATSSMSAVSKQASVVVEEVALAQSLRDGEAALIRECSRLGMVWTVIRPTLIYGAGLDKSLTPLARRAQRWRLFPLPVAQGLRQPVHADDLADACLRALESPAAAAKVFEMGGGERLSAAEMFRRVRASLPQFNLLIPLGRASKALMRFLLPSTRGPLSRLDTDLIADNGPIQQALGVVPRPFKPTADMWLPKVSGGGVQ